MPRKNASPEILNAARALLIEGGGDFEMSDVARRAGVSEGLAYHYFQSKSGLLSAIIEEFYERYDGVMNKRFDGAIPWAEREKDRLRGIVKFLYDEPLAPIIMGRMTSAPQVAAVELSGYEATLELSVRNIRDGIRRGDISDGVDPHVAAAAISGAVRHAFAYAMSAKKRPSAHRLTEQLWGMIAGALGLAEENANSVEARVRHRANR